MTTGASGTSQWIVKSVVLEHGDKDIEPAIGEAAESSTVSVPGRSHAGIGILAGLVAGDADARPVVECSLHAFVTSVAPTDDGFLSALPGDRRGTGITTQGMIISFRDSL